MSPYVLTSFGNYQHFATPFPAMLEYFQANPKCNTLPVNISGFIYKKDFFKK